MIINQVKLGKSFLFFGNKVIIVTDEGNISLDYDFDSETVSKLNDLLKNFKIEGADDFRRLKETLNAFLDKYSMIENVIFNSIKNSWRFFDPATAQVPRPMNIIFKKNIGVTEYVVFSLNANDFDGALNANRHVADYLNNKLGDITNKKEEEILMLLKEAIDSEHELINFELRLGVIFNNYYYGKYKYLDKELDAEQQYEFVSKLIKKYSVVYVENPFKEDDLVMYKKLTSDYKTSCLVCMNSKINEYSKGINDKAFNAVIVKFVDIPSFVSDVKILKDNNINVIATFDTNMDVVVGLGIPLVKLDDSKESDVAARRLSEIVTEIAEFKKA